MITDLAMEVIQEVEGVVMVEEIGLQQGRMTASNVAGLGIGLETVRQLEVEVAEAVAAHSLLHVLGMLQAPPPVVEIVMRMFVKGTWMISTIEAVMMTEIDMRSKMIDMGAVIVTLTTGILIFIFLSVLYQT